MHKLEVFVNRIHHSLFAELISCAVTRSILSILSISLVVTVTAILPLGNILGISSAVSETTTSSDNGKEAIPYAESSALGAYPLIGHSATSDGSINIVKEEPFTILAEFVFREHKLPHQDYILLFQIMDDNYFTYEIYQVAVNTTNAHYHRLSTSLYGFSAEPRYGITFYATPTVDKHGNYTVQAFVWTNLDNLLPLADAARSTITVFERYNEVRKGDLSLSIETSKTVHMVDMAPASMILALTNLGDSDLIIKSSDDQTPLYLTLWGTSYNDNHSKINSKEFSPQCSLDNSQSNHVLKGTEPMISLKAGQSIKLECSLEDRIGPKMFLAHYTAVGTVTGKIEHLNGDVDSKKPSEEFVNISTRAIDFWVGSASRS